MYHQITSALLGHLLGSAADIGPAAGQKNHRMFGKLFTRFPALTPALPQGLHHNRDLAPFVQEQPVSATDLRAAVLIRHCGRI